MAGRIGADIHPLAATVWGVLFGVFGVFFVDGVVESSATDGGGPPVSNVEGFELGTD